MRFDDRQPDSERSEGDDGAAEVNCLLVDDSQENLLALGALLRDEAVVLHTARSAEEALDLLLRHDFAVALVDVQMPGLSGIELAEVMRGSERTKQIPIIFVTGGTWDEHRVFQGYESGAVDFLYKPIDPHVVRSKVRVFAELKRNMVALEKALSEAQSARSRMRLLSDAGAALMSSLDRTRGLSALSQVVLPTFADALVVDLLTPGRLRVQEPFLEDVSGTRDEALRELTDAQDGPLGRAFVQDLLARGRSAVWQAAGSLDGSALAKLGFGSMMTTPLQAHGRRFGAVFLLRNRGRRAFDPADQELAEELVRRVALSVDNVRLFEETERALRLRDEFLSVASHELRTPLTSMGLQIQRAVRMLDAPQAAGPLTEPLLRVHQTLQRQSRTLQGLVEDMLDVTHASSGALVLDRREVSLSELVTNVAEEYSEQLAAAGCRLALDVEPGCVGAFDTRRLVQVVGNLLANAAKYAPGSPVHVTLRCPGDSAQLCVRDEGPGISNDAQSRIFERYQRADTVGHLPGLGLGLYVVRQIVLVHGGEVRVESRAGEGTSFFVELPLEHLASTASEEAVFSQ